MFRFLTDKIMVHRRLYAKNPTGVGKYDQASYQSDSALVLFLLAKNEMNAVEFSKPGNWLAISFLCIPAIPFQFAAPGRQLGSSFPLIKHVVYV